MSGRERAGAGKGARRLQGAPAVAFGCGLSSGSNFELLDRPAESLWLEGKLTGESEAAAGRLEGRRWPACPPTYTGLLLCSDMTASIFD